MIVAVLAWVRVQLGNLLTGIDNKTLDPARVGMIVAIITVLGVTIFYLATGVRLALREISEAFGIAIGSGAGGAALTHSSQPKGDGE